MTKPRQARMPIKETAVNKIYPFIVRYQKKHKGLSPTLFEVAKEFDRTVEWVRVCYKELVKLNMIRVDYYKQRGVLIVGK